MTESASEFDAAQIAVLRSLRGGALLPQLLKVYRDEARRQLAELATAVTAADPATLRSVSHTLKSSSFSVGAKRVGELCAALETGVRSQTLTDGGTLLTTQIAAAYESLLPELEQLIS
jgi:HPt (histidine-containing phosphotransfer) domain-containing protein